jgi:hypothetical protein
MARVRLPPFASQDQLVPNVLTTQTSAFHIPNQPDVPCGSTSVEEFLSRELGTPLLDRIYDHLWLVAKKSGRHIDSLHEHVIKQRKLTIAENPKLHLIWYHSIVFLKPIPYCLLNHDFWNDFLVPRAQTLGQDTYDVKFLSSSCRAALGFLRSYSLLIQHESDFILAQQANLVPKSITYIGFARFIGAFRDLPDEAVAVRYHYGQMRLTRLNYAVRILRPLLSGNMIPWNYQQHYWQTGQFLERLGAPLLLSFAAFSLVLSSMQVALAALGQNIWASFSKFSWGFSVAVILLVAAIFISILLGIIAVLVAQAQFAMRKKRKETKDRRVNESGKP